MPVQNEKMLLHVKRYLARQARAGHNLGVRQASTGPHLSGTLHYSKLTQSEGSAMAVAEHQRNYAAYVKGFGYCDRSRLAPSEVRGIPAQPLNPRQFLSRYS